MCRNFIDINTDKIEEDENNEFKKTFALDVKTRKREKYIIEECITTIAGFLNTQGGTLFIGVNDGWQDSWNQGRSRAAIQK